MRCIKAVLPMLLLATTVHAAEPRVNVNRPWAPKSDRAAVTQELRDVTAAGIDRRLGPDYAAYHPNTKAEGMSTIYLVPQKQDNGGRPYQIGGPWNKKSAGDYSSTQGQILYAPDGETFPVDRVTIIEWAHGCFTEAPLPPWHGGFRPEPASKKWLSVAPGGNPGVPIAMARGMGSWANNGVIIFSSGLISAAGTVTARGLEPHLQLPPNKIPTAVSVTNKNEFALVTIVDTETHQGQLAVIALQVDGKRMKFVHEWQDEHAWSLPSVAIFANLKLLGYLDLPGIEFPTSVCAVGNHEGGRMNGRDGNAGLLREYSLTKQADRDVFLKGSNAGYSSTAGLAVVGSKYDNKVAFVDLEPLFTRVREMYFTTEENFQKTRDSGLDPRQWPQAFEVDPSWKPSVVKVIDVTGPTAVLASMSGDEKAARAYVASIDGTVGIYGLGGLASAKPTDPADIKRIAEVNVGRNPTCLAYQKYSKDKIIAVSRGDRQIDWVQIPTKGNEGPKVIRTLRDSRLIDPVFVEMADTHGVSTSIITVADFAGKKILNYRFSRCVFATQGGAKFDMGPDGKDDFECGGILEFPGKPYGVSATNVN